MPAITLSGIEKNYGAAPSAVPNLDLTIPDGEFVCLLGPSGCGKTTTLRMIAGLEHPTRGRIQVGEKVVDDVATGVFVPAEKRGMGLVFQNYALWPHLTIEQNIEFGLRLRKVVKKTLDARVHEVMSTMGIEKYRGRYPSELSGGQQQRVALARMLAVNPEVLLLDEPLSNLDARLRLEMRSELKRIHAQYNSTVVLVTHDQWEAMTLATRIAVLNEGELQQEGTPNEIYEQPANRFVAEFVGNPPINIIEMVEGDPLARDIGDVVSRVVEPGSEVGSVGIRPESLRLADSIDAVPLEAATTSATVTGILPTGGSWIIELNAGGQNLFMSTSDQPEALPGSSVTVWTKPKYLNVFDTAGLRLPARQPVLTH
jgi:iron(III) transport system ATP-binding protein